MKIEYPIWFNAAIEPTFTEKEPQEFKNVDSVMSHVEQNVFNLSTLQIPSGATHLDVEYLNHWEHCDDEIKVTFYNCQTIKNLNLEKECVRFEKRLKEWKKWRTTWEAEKISNEQDRERELLRKLKEKYEK